MKAMITVFQKAPSAHYKNIQVLNFPSFIDSFSDKIAVSMIYLRKPFVDDHNLTFPTNLSFFKFSLVQQIFYIRKTLFVLFAVGEYLIYLIT